MTTLYTQEEYDLSKSSDLLPLKCEHCGKTFYVQKKLITHELNNLRGRCKFCSMDCFYESKKTRIKVNCGKCGKELEIKKSVYNDSKTKRFFCSQSCAASFNNAERGAMNEETKEKIKQSLKQHYKTLGRQANLEQKKDTNTRERKERTCKVCGKTYYYSHLFPGTTRVVCSKECSEIIKKHRKEFLPQETIEKLRNAGRNSAKSQANKRRSKNEKYFCELCEKHFKNVKHNVPMFNGWDADVIIEDIKTAILWNGKWHYKKITEKHSIEQVQNRDSIKIEEIIKMGYKPYIIKDMGKYNPLFVEEEFKKFIAD